MNKKIDIETQWHDHCMWANKCEQMWTNGMPIAWPEYTNVCIFKHMYIQMCVYTNKWIPLLPMPPTYLNICMCVYTRKQMFYKLKNWRPCGVNLAPVVIDRVSHFLVKISILKYLMRPTKGNASTQMS